MLIDTNVKMLVFPPFQKKRKKKEDKCYLHALIYSGLTYTSTCIHVPRSHSVGTTHCANTLRYTRVYSMRHKL